MSIDRRVGWLAHLKAGDAVYVQVQDLGRAFLRNATVKRLTPTGRIVVLVDRPRLPSYQQTFRPDGAATGDLIDNWNRAKLYCVNDENTALKRRQQAVAKLIASTDRLRVVRNYRKVMQSKATTEQIEQTAAEVKRILALLEE